MLVVTDRELFSLSLSLSLSEIGKKVTLTQTHTHRRTHTHTHTHNIRCSLLSCLLLTTGNKVNAGSKISKSRWLKARMYLSAFIQSTSPDETADTKSIWLPSVTYIIFQQTAARPATQTSAGL